MVAHSNSAHTARWAGYFQHLGMVVRVISPTPDAIPGIDVIQFPPDRRWYHALKGLHLYLDYPAWRSIFHEFHPDITHVHYPDVGGRSRFYFNGVHPLITSTWGSEVVESLEFPLSAKHKQGVRRMLRRSSVVTATSRFLAHWTARYCPPGTPIHIIPFGVDCDVFTPDPSRRPKADGPVRLGFFKNLERKYGPEVLIEAFARVVGKHANAKLVMCGKGDMASGLKARAQELGMSDNVEFPGRLPHEQVVTAMHACDIVVMPSTCQESFGVAALEASACQIPVVASRVGGVCEAVVDGQTGLLVPSANVEALADACLKLIGDPDLRQRLGVAGRQFVLDHYQWQANASLMANLYVQILHKTRPQSSNMIVASEET